jgi:hypothetical protein
VDGLLNCYTEEKNSPVERMNVVEETRLQKMAKKLPNLDLSEIDNRKCVLKHNYLQPPPPPPPSTPTSTHTEPFQFDVYNK